MVDIFSSSFFGELKQNTRLVKGIKSSKVLRLNFLNIKWVVINNLLGIYRFCYRLLQAIKINTLFISTHYFLSKFVETQNLYAKTLDISDE